MKPQMPDVGIRGEMPALCADPVEGVINGGVGKRCGHQGGRTLKRENSRKSYLLSGREASRYGGEEV